MGNIKAVLFDLDGTILNTYEVLRASFRHATRTVLNEVIPDEVLLAKVGTPLSDQMWDFTDDQEKHDELLVVYRAYNAKIHDEMVELYPGIKEAMIQLHNEGYRLGVVTSKFHKPAVRGLEIFGLDTLLNFVSGADDWPIHKPLPGAVLRGCELLNLQPEECVYVGDSPFDMQSGNGAGVITVGATWGFFSEEALRNEAPDYLCSHAKALPTLVRKLG